MGFDAGDPNLYRYVGNSPTNATDPSGKFIQFDDKKQAEVFAEMLKTKYGAKHVSVVVGKIDAYVVVDPRDREAVFKYADDKYSAVFKVAVPFSDKEVAAVAKERNKFLVAAGVFGSIADPYRGFRNPNETYLLRRYQQILMQARVRNA